jgi:hypothetical protein
MLLLNGLIVPFEWGLQFEWGQGHQSDSNRTTSSGWSGPSIRPMIVRHWGIFQVCPSPAESNQFAHCCSTSLYAYRVQIRPLSCLTILLHSFLRLYLLLLRDGRRRWMWRPFVHDVGSGVLFGLICQTAPRLGHVNQCYAGRQVCRPLRHPQAGGGVTPILVQ